MKRQHTLHPQNEPPFPNRLRCAFGLVYALARIAWLPAIFFMRAVHFMDALGRALICGLLRGCLAILALMIFSGVILGILRTVLHPWFA